MPDNKKPVSFRFPAEFVELLAQLKTQTKFSHTTIIMLAVQEWAQKQNAHPWLDTAGMFADDPALLPMVKEIYDERQKSRLADDKEDR